MPNAKPLFDIAGKVAVITGGSGVVGSALVHGLAACGARLVVACRSGDPTDGAAESMRTVGGEVMCVACNVLDRKSIEESAKSVLNKWGRVDILVNGAGGNRKEATTSEDCAFFDLPTDALKAVTELNLLGTILPSQVFGRIMANQQEGIIVNISSMNAFRPLTRVVGYAAAKAAVNNFTQWLAVHMAQNYAPSIRVNAIAPGFFETAQNHFLLRNEGGELTDRGRQILAHTPAGRFGEPGDLLGTLVWLVSAASSFVSGVVVPVDGGFSAYSGV